MLRLLTACLLLSGTLLAADDPAAPKLAAPEGWGGETIELPPKFALDMKLKGTEHIRFAPGMMKAGSDSFFSYAFAFELQPEPALTETVLKEEFLKYYRGLCKAVLNGKLPEVDPSEFKLELKRAKADDKPAADDKDAAGPARDTVHYTGTLDWVEPFATKKPQKLNLEIQTWSKNKRNYIFVCVSPQTRDAAIWKQLHAIRDGYLSTAFGISALPDDGRLPKAMFAVYPITSDLQRARLARSDAEAPRLRAYVALSGNDLFDKNGALRLDAVPAEEITKALAPYADRENGMVVLNVQNGNEADGSLRSPSQGADESLRGVFENLGLSAGFKSVMVSGSYGGPILAKKFAQVTDKVKGQADEDETPSGDELVKVYPVRSILGLLLTDNMDCVVVVRAPLENDGENLLSPEIHAAIAKHVAAVKLRDKTKILISIKTRGNRISNERIDKFYHIEVIDLAKSLGFDSASVQHARTN